MRSTLSVRVKRSAPQRKRCAGCSRKFKVPGTKVGLLSTPSKMPGLSWSIPAGKSCPRETGDICKHCYAKKGRYIFENVLNAQRVRFEWTIDSMRSEEGRRFWVYWMTEAIRGQEYFRVHDSGDMFNRFYVECWYEVALALPATKFWIPTRSWQHPKALLIFDPILSSLRKLAMLPNVTVRPSALNFGDAPPIVPGLHAGSTANYSGPISHCPARSQGGHCGACRHCWDSKEESVSYPKH